MSDLPKTSLRNSEGLYQHLFDSAPDVLLVIDRAGRIEVANSRCKDVLQFPPDDLYGQTVSNLLDPSCKSDFAALLTGMSEGTTMPEVEVTVLSASGRSLPMMLDIRQIEASDGAYLVRLRDLREIKALEQEYRGLFESIADAVFIGDPETGQILQANRRACEITGYQLGELMGQDFEFVHSEMWEVVRKALNDAGGRSPVWRCTWLGRTGRKSRWKCTWGSRLTVRTAFLSRH